MDTECAYYNKHPKMSDGSSAGMQSIELNPLLDLLRDQLAETMHRKYTPMCKQRPRATMFKIALALHGYTFASRGPIAASVTDLELESQFYERLRPIKGSIVSVCMGNIKYVYP